MNTKAKVKFWLRLDKNLRDSDSRLCANIWAKELMKEKGLNLFELNAVEFLRMYSNNELTSAPSIKRARAKLQEEEPKYRGEKYNLRKGVLQDKWRKDLGYEKNS
tara:strand:- start:203 stop:517 length:315 start_codon:yes stop_codon:yes gene_type:complete